MSSIVKYLHFYTDYQKELVFFVGKMRGKLKIFFTLDYCFEFVFAFIPQNFRAIRLLSVLSYGRLRMSKGRMKMPINCQLAGTCSGCTWIQKTYTDQLDEKKRDFLALWEAAGLPGAEDLSPEIHSGGEGELRDRTDMTIHREEGGLRFGLYDMERRHIVDITTCPQMSPQLADWFGAFREHLPDLDLGSVRLRVAPDGTRGAWLDFPNIEIKRLLDERTWLTQLTEMGHVEMSQRRRPLLIEPDRLRLGRESILKPWFETYLGTEERALPLYCTVGSFTQPGFAANRILVRQVMQLARSLEAGRWLELGSGIGNFTLPLLAEGWQVVAVENDVRANDGLQRSADEAGLTEGLTLRVVNMHRAPSANYQPGMLLEGCDAILADPPRSGLRAFTEVLDAVEDKPRHLLYVSCFAKSLVADSVKLYEMGYRLQSLQGLDQFPQSPHCEWIAHFQRG